MSHYEYLIIDAEMMAAAPTGSLLHQPGLHGSIGLVGKLPVDSDQFNNKTLWNSDNKAENPDVAFHLGQIAPSINLKTKCITDHIGQVCTFEKLLLATGDTPCQLPFGAHRIIYFRTLQDYQWLRVMAKKINHFAVIGGGFMGAEVAAALAMNGKEVVMVFQDKESEGRIFPIDLSLFLNEYFHKKGVIIQAQELVTKLIADGGLLRFETKNKHPVAVNNVMIEFNRQELAEMAGLQDANEMEFLRLNDSSTSDAEDDTTAVTPPSFEKRIRVENQDTSLLDEKSTESAHYHHLPFFESDIPTFLNWNTKEPSGWAHSLTLFRIGRSHLTQV